MEKEMMLTVNGKKRTVKTDPKRPLLDVLREDLKLTGTNFGCREGLCGACTVLIEGKPTHSCMISVGGVANKLVTTVEGLADGDTLHPVQQAFLDEGAFQCGYCTPGMILNAVALLRKHPHPTDDQICEWMNGNICRCNGYHKIISAIRRAADKISEGNGNE